MIEQSKSWKTGIERVQLDVQELTLRARRRGDRITGQERKQTDRNKEHVDSVKRTWRYGNVEAGNRYSMGRTRTGYEEKTETKTKETAGSNAQV